MSPCLADQPSRVLSVFAHVHGGKEDCPTVPVQQWSSKLQAGSVWLSSCVLLESFYIYWHFFTSFHTNLMWNIHVLGLYRSNVIFLIFLSSYLPLFTAAIICFQFITEMDSTSSWKYSHLLLQTAANRNNHSLYVYLRMSPSLVLSLQLRREPCVMLRTVKGLLLVSKTL